MRQVRGQRSDAPTVGRSSACGESLFTKEPVLGGRVGRVERECVVGDVDIGVQELRGRRDKECSQSRCNARSRSVASDLCHPPANGKSADANSADHHWLRQAGPESLPKILKCSDWPTTRIPLPLRLLPVCGYQREDG